MTPRLYDGILPTRSIRTGLVFAILLLCGCPSRFEVGESPQAEEPARTLEIGERVQVEFPSDGLWHPAPYTAHAGQAFKLRPLGPAQGLAANAVRFRIGRLPQVLIPDQVLRVTEPGKFAMRIAPRMGQSAPPVVSVEIERVQ